MLPILVLLAAQTVVPSDQSAPVPSEVHVFEDWVVACDNGRRCQAVGVQPEGREFDGAGVMVIERGAEADAQPTVRLTDVEGLPERLSVLEEALPVRLEAADGDFLIRIEDRSAFLERTLYAEQIDVQGANGAAIGTLSLKGLRHALLYMDEAQGRLHTPTALIRTGNRPARSVPAAPQLPRIRIAPPVGEDAPAMPPSRITELRRETGCTIEDVGGPDEVELHSLGEGRTLVMLACGTGAYNLSVVPFIATTDGREWRIEAAPFDLPLEQWEEQEGHRILINGSWDPDLMTISDFSKGRGIGDCGSRSAYGWDGERFRLIAREEMPECRGSTIYVTTWRTEASR